MYLRLSLLMLLQWAVPGSLIPFYSLRLDKLGFDPVTLGVCCATQAVAGIVSSLITGQVADRWISSEKAMAICATLSGACLWLLGSTTSPVWVFVLTLLFWLATGPMLLLGTTISFANLSDPEKQFGPVRMCGTVGWMAVVWAIGYWLDCPAWLAGVRDWFSRADGIPHDDAPRFGAIIAFVVAVYSLTLPHTPPRPQAGSRWLAPLQALTLFRDRALCVYLCCTLALCLTFPFSTQNVPLLLSDLGLPDASIGRAVSIAQVVEIATLAVLPIGVRLMGLRLTMTLGLASWLIAFGVLAVGRPVSLVVSSLALHGFYVTGFLIAGQVYLNSLAEGDLRASTQGLFNAVNSLGLLVGNLLAGWLRRSTGDLPTTFAFAACIVGATFVLFVFAFRPNERTEKS